MANNEIIEEIRVLGFRIKTVEELLQLKKPILQIQDVSILTGLTKSSIYRFTRLGTIPHYKKAKHLYFDREEILKWLKENRGFDANMSV